ncbi:hypothetical protein E5288_WYG012682 [Bos mutus]|uniref:Uncharacterized protein n=1 Tax=Bos mutus TaxID=72004 RepID=A0A6B0QV49_9CETA|nr:hypothetical protein [Bos mutus]
MDDGDCGAAAEAIPLSLSGCQMGFLTVILLGVTVYHFLPIRFLKGCEIWNVMLNVTFFQMLYSNKVLLKQNPGSRCSGNHIFVSFYCDASSCRVKIKILGFPNKGATDSNMVVLQLIQNRSNNMDIPFPEFHCEAGNQVKCKVIVSEYGRLTGGGRPVCLFGENFAQTQPSRLDFQCFFSSGLHTLPVREPEPKSSRMFSSGIVLHMLNHYFMPDARDRPEGGCREREGIVTFEGEIFILKTLIGGSEML